MAAEIRDMQAQVVVYNIDCLGSNTLRSAGGVCGRRRMIGHKDQLGMPVHRTK